MPSSAGFLPIVRRQVLRVAGTTTRRFYLPNFSSASAGSGIVCLIHGRAPDVSTVFVYFQLVVPHCTSRLSLLEDLTTSLLLVILRYLLRR